MTLRLHWSRAALRASLSACIGMATLLPGLVWADASDSRPQPQAYAITSLVSDGGVAATFNDPNLKNGWGVAFNPNGFVWVTDNGTGKSTLYDGLGKPQSLVVTVPGLGGAVGSPTGIVFSGSADFVVKKNGLQGPARFIFATEDGTISGWAPGVDLINALPAVNNSAAKAVYKGLALAADGSGNFLYAADFHNARVDVFDATYQAVNWPGAFVDPKLPAGYAPFGIQAIQGNVYVSYAKQDAAKHDEIAGPGLGFVAVFDAHGKYLRRVASGGMLNAPWGLAIAPADFGPLSNALLVGNFGDGRISAFDVRDGSPLGQLRGVDGKRLSIRGLWGMAFGNGLNKQNSSALFFAAGPNDEKNGQYGRIDAVPAAGAKPRDDD